MSSAATVFRGLAPLFALAFCLPVVGGIALDNSLHTLPAFIFLGFIVGLFAFLAVFWAHARTFKIRMPEATVAENGSLTIEQLLTLLAENPQRIAALTAGVAPAQLRSTPNHGGWSPNDVLAHIRACADVWGNCIAAIIAEDRPTLRAVNPRTWIKKTDYLELEFKPSFRSFATQRADLLAALEPLPHEAWSRAATVTGAGAVLERSVQFYAQWLARHERTHVKQIERIATALR